MERQNNQTAVRLVLIEAYARNLGVEGYATMSNTELVTAIRLAENEQNARYRGIEGYATYG